MKYFLSPSSTAPTLHFICKYIAPSHPRSCAQFELQQFVGKRMFYHCQLVQMERLVLVDVVDIPWRLMRHVCQTVRGCRDCYCYVRTLQLWAAQNKHYSDRVFCIMHRSRYSKNYYSFAFKWSKRQWMYLFWDDNLNRFLNLMVAGFYRDEEETFGLIYEKFIKLKRISLNTTSWIYYVLKVINIRFVFYNMGNMSGWGQILPILYRSYYINEWCIVDQLN